MPFAWWWISMAVALVLLNVAMWLHSVGPWKLDFYGTNQLTVVTPWVYVILSHEGLDMRDLTVWTGIIVRRRIGSTEPPQRGQRGPLYRTVYEHVLKRTPHEYYYS